MEFQCFLLIYTFQIHMDNDFKSRLEIAVWDSLHQRGLNKEILMDGSKVPFPYKDEQLTITYEKAKEFLRDVKQKYRSLGVSPDVDNIEDLTIRYATLRGPPFFDSNELFYTPGSYLLRPFWEQMVSEKGIDFELVGDELFYSLINKNYGVLIQTPDSFIKPNSEINKFATVRIFFGPETYREEETVNVWQEYIKIRDVLNERGRLSEDPPKPTQDPDIPILQRKFTQAYVASFTYNPKSLGEFNQILKDFSFDSILTG